MKVEHLALNILKNNKLSSEEIIRHLASAIDEDIDCTQEYRELYETAYGHRLSNDILMDWVKSMAITDGSDRPDGQMWSVDQCAEYGTKHGIDWNKHSKYEWYAIMNMMYSDFYNVAKSVEMSDNPDFFARMGKSWLCDEDYHGENKLYDYYFSVIV